MGEMTKPGAANAGQGLDSSLPGRNGLHGHCAPVALAVQKRGRRCIVAKLTHFVGDREPILAVAWRSQQGTKAAISLPLPVLEYARQHGASRFYLRDDKRMTMLTCDLATFDRGQLRSDGERYIPLSWLQPVAWRAWAFTEKVVELTVPQPVATRPTQMNLF